MKTLIIAAALAAAAAAPAMAQTNVSIEVGQPGFYGRIDLGGYAPPPVVYAQPVIIQRPAQYVVAQPVYLRVPPGHIKHWSKHCGAYNACGQQVYFVRDEWYANTYAPRYREEHRGRGHDDHDDHGDHGDHGDRGDRGDRGDDHGHGHGHGKHKD